MDIQLVTKILQTLDSVGIEEAIFEPDPDSQGTKIRGANKSGTIIVYDVIDTEVSSLPMGVQSIRGLLSRIRLFDLEKVSIELKDNGSEIHDMMIKQGRKKASFSFVEPSKIRAPKFVPTDGLVEGIEFTEEYATYLNNAMSSMGYTGTKDSQTVSMSCDESVLEVMIHDGEFDSFVDHVESATEIEDFTKGYWEVAPFKTVMTQSVKHSETKTALMSVNPVSKVAKFSLGDISVMIAPMA